MLPGQTYTLGQIVRVLRRRWWLILVPLTLGTAVGLLAYKWRPVQYRSETLITVIPQPIPDSSLKSRVGTNVESLRSVSEQVLSRSKLERIIQDFDLYKGQRQSGLMEDVVQTMISDIDVKLQNNESSFRVAYVSADPTIAQKVTARLAALFVEENPRDSENLTDSTNSILASQLQDAKRRLIEQEKKVQEYRRRYAGQLPSQLQGNLQSIQNAQRQLRSLNESMNRARERGLLIERQIAQAQALSVEVAFPGTGVSPPEGAAAMSTAQQVESSRARLRDLQAEQEVVDLELASAQAEEVQLKKDMAAYFRKIEVVPTRESELVELTRDYSTLQETYSNLLEKRESSKLAANLERRQIGEQFRILDPASLPGRPYNQQQRLAVLFGGPLCGLALGVLLVGFLEYRDSSFKCEDDVLRVLSLPVLAMIPVMDAEGDAPGRRRLGRLSL